MLCESEHLTDESREVREPFDSAQGDPSFAPKSQSVITLL